MSVRKSLYKSSYFIIRIMQDTPHGLIIYTTGRFPYSFHIGKQQLQARHRVEKDQKFRHD